mgnify:CR=1 FL=1
MIPAELAAELAELTDVSRETLQRFEAMQALLERWTPRINLVSRATLASYWTRHVLDSAQLWPLRPPGARKWVDLGSGAGFPGLVIAMIAKEVAPDLDVVLVESDSRKAAYLAAVARETGIAPRLINTRVEHVASLQADVLSARALAPLADLLDMAGMHRRPDGICLFPKGRAVHKEMEAARVRWVFSTTEHRSMTDPTATILEIGAMHRV